MNPFFAVLAAVAFGLVVVGADASAAPQPSRPAPTRKAAPVAKAAVKPVSKPAPKVVAKSPVRPAVAVKAGKVSASRGVAPATPAARPSQTRPAQTRVAPAKGVAGKPAPAVKAVGRGAKAAAPVVKAVPAVKPAPVVKGRKVQPEPVVAVTRDPRSQHRGRVVVAPPAPVVERAPVVKGGGAPIGREAFVPTTPPIPRAEAVRQLQGRVASPVAAPRASLTIPPPAVEVSRAASRPVPVAEAPLQATSELPRQVARYTPAPSEMSGPEAAAAAAAALNASRAAEMPRPVVPLPAAAAPASPVVERVAPAAPPAVLPAAVPPQPQARSGRGVARAYAMDGATFYQSGRKIRVQGLDARDPGMTSEHATQRLQRALDAGSVTVEPVEVDGSGHTVAVVRVNGRNVADAVRASTN